LTVDNYREQSKYFLAPGYQSNVSHFVGDPARLSKGAHSVFAGVFVQKYPTDLWCYQQALHDLRPDVVIELGSSQGGSAVWFGSMIKLFGLRKIVTVDLALEQAYWLKPQRAYDAVRRLGLEPYIDFNYVLDGSKNPDFRRKVQELCATSRCMVVSDSNHDYEHTFPEIEFYAKMVAVGQYLVVEDTNIYGWSGFLNINDPNLEGFRIGPMEAANEFERQYPDFERTDWCARQYMLSQSPHGWFFRSK
jgi:cephalosporin hydroxylase